jgi:hypothetical protein
MLNLKPVLLLTALLFSLPATSAPAPWYKWISTFDRRIVCTQTSPGEGWALYAGPYQDAQCRRLGTID